MSRRKPRSYLPCWPHLPVLLQQTLFFCFLCCCLSAAFLLLLSDLRLRLACFWSSPLSTRRSRWRSRRSSRRQDEDQDGDEHKDQGDTHLVIITEATLEILDLHLRRALFLFEDTGAIAAEELTIASSVDRVEVEVGANKGDADFFGVSRCFFL